MPESDRWNVSHPPSPRLRRTRQAAHPSASRNGMSDSGMMPIPIGMRRVAPSSPVKLAGASGGEGLGGVGGGRVLTDTPAAFLRPCGKAYPFPAVVPPGIIEADKPSRCIIEAIMLSHPGKSVASCSLSRCGVIVRTMQKVFKFFRTMRVPTFSGRTWCG